MTGYIRREDDRTAPTKLLMLPYTPKLDELICPLMRERCSPKCVFRYGRICLIAEYLKRQIGG